MLSAPTGTTDPWHGHLTYAFYIDILIVCQ
jgi:hypothetical protein